MEEPGLRPVWSMSGSDMLTELDHLHALLARHETRRLELLAGLETIGHAQEVGAHDTARLLEFRYRLDRTRARRDVHLAQSLPKYPAVTAALPTTAKTQIEEVQAPEAHDAEADADVIAGVLLSTAQAEAIVTALEKVPNTVPVEDLAVAERELVGLARHLSPAELRRAGTRIRDVLDTDGPEPEEHKAYARESLTLSAADRGVKFRGYLANENAELFRTLIHAGARPHKTIDGAPDPRPQDKRQADALTTALTLAATALDAGAPSPTLSRPAISRPNDADSQASGSGGAAGVVADSVPGFGAKANVTVTIDLQDLKGRDRRRNWRYGSRRWAVRGRDQALGL
ncbi:DUF222 domain-containing protein [Kribbella sp. NPDC049584]|uniref:DUF222 domain-containing protein n=1 Tax=Kribbella sp. NPDC049584 TaxID=3154833 RepID=UPI003448313F